MGRTRILLGLLGGGIAALGIFGVAMAHPGFGIVDRVDVLARALGISSDEVRQAREDGTLHDMLRNVTLGQLEDARDAAVQDAIDAAVAGGSITADQATRLSDALNADPPTPDQLQALRDSLGDIRGAIHVDGKAVLADVLGITPDELDQARQDGTLRDLLAGVDRVKLAAAMLDARDAAIQDALAAGDITQDQADLLQSLGTPGLGVRGPCFGPGRFGHGLGPARQQFQQGLQQFHGRFGGDPAGAPTRGLRLRLGSST